MTNKQAQITINAIKFMLDNAQYSDDVEEALNMAISALTEQPEERTEKRTETHACDLIDREAAVDAIYHHLPSVSRTRARTMLHEVPSAQPSSSCAHENDTISRQAAIDVEGIDEQIRCEMCRNPMHTDRGCDGNCKYDEKLYERIMQILDERIKPLPSAQPDLSSYSDKLWRNAYERGRKDAVEEIIHCRDCENWEKTWTDDFPQNYHYCSNVDGIRDDNFFCANGERREK